MKDFKDKVAVITGGAGGVGRAIAFALAKEGAKVVVSDVEDGAIDKTVTEIKATGADVIGVRSDVTKLEQLHELREKAIAEFGAIHLVFANAGIGAGEFGNMWDYNDNDWNWALNVNVWGVINSIRAFMGYLTEQNEDSHFVITGSANGALIHLPYTPIYACTKAAVQSITENLYHQVQMMGSEVKVNGLFPGPHAVATGIFDSGRNRPDELPDDPNKPDFGFKSAEDMKRMMKEAGVEMEITTPEEVAETALQGIRENKFWILPLTQQIEDAVQSRHDSIMNRTAPPLVQMDG